MNQLEVKADPPTVTSDGATPPVVRSHCSACGASLQHETGPPQAFPSPEMRPARLRSAQPWLRFGLVFLLPTGTLVLLVLIILGTGAPTRSPDLGLLTARVAGVTATQIALLALTVLLLAVITTPFQLAIVRLIEGYWGASAVGDILADLGVRLQRHRIDRLARYLNRRGAKSRDVRMRRVAQVGLAAYPDGELLPTRLGNALRAAEERAGQRYGLDTIEAWPRLYPQLSARLAETITDLRNQLDASARFCAVFLLATAIAIPLLAVHGPWLLVPAATALASWIAYRAAVSAAVAHGRQLHVAFDLHRFDLLRSLSLPLPPDPPQEVALNQDLSRFFRESWTDPTRRFPAVRYEHSPEEPPSSS